MKSKNLKQALDYFLTAKFKVHDNVIFHEAEDYILLTTIDRADTAYKITGVFAPILKLIFLRAAQGVKDIQLICNLVDKENPGSSKSHRTELEESVVTLYSFLILNEFLEDRFSKSLKHMATLTEVRTDQVYHIGSLRGEIMFLQDAENKNFGLSNEELAIHVAGTMTACSSY